jgi:hypothetical protein
MEYNAYFGKLVRKKSMDTLDIVLYIYICMYICIHVYINADLLDGVFYLYIHIYIYTCADGV